MAKNIKCSRCKYLKPRPKGISSNPYFSFGVFICDADKSVHISEFEIEKIKDCQFYRGTAETAEKEVFKKYIIQVIPDALRGISKLFFK